MLTTTLENIRAHSPCESGYKKLLLSLGKTKSDNDPISFIEILESNGLDDALWCLRVEPENKELQGKSRLFAVFCARQVEHLLTDERSKNAIFVAEKFKKGEATSEELAAAAESAESAAWSAAQSAAESAARSAAWSAARSAAWSAARSAARSAWSAARSAAQSAAWSARSAAESAAESAARSARSARSAQKQEFIRLFGED